ncbi:MAG: YceD family protein [Rudaea sp.]|nr:YceD family protein [Rudaea sp.]
MNAALPEIVDAWRMVQARRSFQGILPLAAMPRLRGSLAATGGVVTFDLEFGKDDLGVPHIHLRADTSLPLTCQRTLEQFELPVHIDARLGLITQEAEEAGLPAGYEPLLTSDGALRLADVVEDELILALPVVPVKPGAPQAASVWTDKEETQAAAKPNPFAALAEMKAKRK